MNHRPKAAKNHCEAELSCVQFRVGSKGSSGYSIRHVTFQLQFKSDCQSFASNMDQVAKPTVSSGQLSLLPSAGW